MKVKNLALIKTHNIQYLDQLWTKFKNMKNVIKIFLSERIEPFETKHGWNVSSDGRLQNVCIFCCWIEIKDGHHSLTCFT